MFTRTCFLALLVFGHLTATADMGTVHCLEITITLRDGATRHVYYNASNLPLGRDEQGFYYQDSGVAVRLRSNSYTEHSINIASTDYHFSNFVKRILADTIWAWEDAIFVLSPTYDTVKHPLWRLSAR